MNSTLSKYFVEIRQGDLLFSVTTRIPLLFWIVALYMLWPHFKENKAKFKTTTFWIFCKVLAYLFVILPFILAFYAYLEPFIFGSSSQKKDLALSRRGRAVNACLEDPKDTNKTNIEILKYLNLKCMKLNNQYVKNLIHDLFNKYKEVGNATLYLVLLAFATFKSKIIHHDRFVILALNLSFLFGVLGCGIIIFTRVYDIDSLWFVIFGYNILTIYASSMGLAALRLFYLTFMRWM